MNNYYRSKIYLQTIICVMCLLVATSITADTVFTIERDRAVLRDGPASFYDIITELSRGVRVNMIEEQDDWYKVSYSNYRGFLSPRMTRPAPERRDVFSQMGTQETTLDVSQHAMSAGVKGFGERFSQTFRGDKDFLELALASKINAQRYRSFKRDTYRGMNLKRIRRRVAVPASDVPEYYSLAEEGLGLGIASKIAALGLYNNQVVHEYINFIGNLIVEASDVYDNTYKFFILDIDNPNAYATPGGIIFITRGMLKMIQTEAELALVLAHEIAHTARFHAVIEMEHRKHHIGSDDAFAAMDSFFEEHLPDAISEETKELIKDLEEESFRIYETLIEGRLDEYEEEADYLAMIYAARAGYDPQGLQVLLERLISSNSLSNNEHYTVESNRMRINKINANLKKINYPGGLLINRERYQRHKRNI